MRGSTLDTCGVPTIGDSLLFGRPQVKPTPNRAKRALRPAVGARKLWQCAKSNCDAGAWVVYPRVIRTRMPSQAIPVMDALAQRWHPPHPHHVHPWPGGSAAHQL